MYNVFSDTFKSGMGVDGKALPGLVSFMPVCICPCPTSSGSSRKGSCQGWMPPRGRQHCSAHPRRRYHFCIPFIKIALGHRPDLAYILAPLLMYAPTQLLLGSSILVPKMIKLIEKEDENNSGSGI